MIIKVLSNKIWQNTKPAIFRSKNTKIDYNKKFIPDSIWFSL